MLPSPHNLRAYDEFGVKWEHFPMSRGEAATVLTDLYPALRVWLSGGERVLVHQEELGDMIQGVVAGYLVYASLVPSPAEAISIVERITQRQMGPPGRELVGAAAELAS